MRAASTATDPRVLSIARSAVEGLAPVVVVNRRIDTAVDQVDGANDEPFPTIHRDARTDVTTSLRRIWRTANERLRGTHGDGVDQGRTVYGSVRFVPVQDAADGAQSVIDALARHGGVGVSAYGPVSFILKPEAMLTRSTFAADDTGVTLARVRPPDDVAQVVAERIDRGSPTNAIPSAEELLAMPTAAARDAVRGWLLSDALGAADGYLEAQVRRMTPEDVLGVAVDVGPLDDHRSMLDPGRVPTSDDIDRLRMQLDRHGVPLRVVGRPFAPG